MITVGSIYWTLETEEVLTATDGNKVCQETTVRFAVHPDFNDGLITFGCKSLVITQSSWHRQPSEVAAARGAADG